MGDKAKQESTAVRRGRCQSLSLPREAWRREELHGFHEKGRKRKAAPSSRRASAQLGKGRGVARLGSALQVADVSGLGKLCGRTSGCPSKGRSLKEYRSLHPRRNWPPDPFSLQRLPAEFRFHLRLWAEKGGRRTWGCSCWDQVTMDRFEGISSPSLDPLPERWWWWFWEDRPGEREAHFPHIGAELLGPLGDPLALCGLLWPVNEALQGGCGGGSCPRESCCSRSRHRHGTITPILSLSQQLQNQ